MNYRQAILIHGFLVPVLLAVVLALVIVFASSRVTSGQAEREMDYQTFESLQQQLQVNKSNLGDKRPLMRAWSEVVTSEFRPRLSLELPRILSRFPGGRLEQTSENPARGGTGLGVTGGQPASRIDLEFRGGFEAMQLALLELENRLPQMQLESLAIQPGNGRENLVFRSTYTAWETSSAP